MLRPREGQSYLKKSHGEMVIHLLVGYGQKIKHLLMLGDDADAFFSHGAKECPVREPNYMS